MSAARTGPQPLPGDLLAPLRAFVLSNLQGAFGGGRPNLAEYAAPPGDPGLFGPGSMPWRVHADLPSMLVGGLSALMLQSLHPLAMAGVAEHSHFHDDYLGRLGRTARFIAGTTFGATPFAEQLLEQVREIHGYVNGVASDGRRYDANDPGLLRWVHCAEVWSFLRGYQRHSLRPLFRAERDRYVAEMAVIAQRLGADQVPTSTGELRAYLAAVRPELAATPGSLQAAAFLRRPPSVQTLPELAVHRIVFDAAVELLPGWAARLLHLRRPPAAALPATVAANGLGALLRWAIGDSVIAREAARRAAAVPEPEPEPAAVA